MNQDCSKAHYCTESGRVNFSVESPQPTFLKTLSRSFISTPCISWNKAIKKANTQSQTKKQESKGRANCWQTGRIMISRWTTCYSIDHEELWFPGNEQDHVSMCSLLPWFRASLYTRDDARLVVFIRGSVPDSIPCDLILGISQNELDFVTDLFSKFQFMW